MNNNSNNQIISQPKQSILLYPPRFMSEEIKSKAIAMSQTNKAFMISAISISIISLIFGEASLFIETLSTLQYQSYLKFINLDYPENLYIYFQTSEMLLIKNNNFIISLSNYLQNLKIEYILGVLTRKEDNEIRTDGKFRLYEVHLQQLNDKSILLLQILIKLSIIDCDLILNLIPQLFQLIIYLQSQNSIQFITIILISKKMCVKYYNYFSTKFENYDLKTLQCVNEQFILVVLNFGQQIKKLLKYKYQFSLRLILPIFALNAWDILFKLLLQIHFNQKQNAREQFQYIFSLSILIMYLTIALQSYSKSSHKNFYTKKYFLQIRYAALDIFRTFIFQIVLIFCQNQSIIQSLLIAINSILHCFCIYKYQQVNNLEKFVNIFTEATIQIYLLFIFYSNFYSQINLLLKIQSNTYSLTTFAYYKENIFSYQTILYVGFFHMGILMMSLALVFCKQIVKKIQIISTKILKYQAKQKENKNEIFS